MNILDLIVIILIGYGAFRGWKYGCFSSIVSLIGSILVFVIAFYLKNPLSTVLYENLPFHTFGGIFKGITSVNILVYEGISYLICLIILASIISVILKITGIVDKLINLTFILALPSKLLGLVIGALQFYVFVFAGLFIMAQIPVTAEYYNKSELGKGILTKTPLLSNVTNDLYYSVSEVYDICLDYEGEDDKTQGDYEALEVLLKYDIITTESVQKLVDKGKLKIDGTDELIKKYSEGSEDQEDDSDEETTTTTVKEG